MLLRLSHFRLNAYVVLVVSKQKGITLVFKTDPLQNVDVSSTFDSIAVIQKYIQREIEGQLREMFREDLPGIIHRLSQRWLAGKAKVETPYAQQPRVPLSSLPSVAEHEPTSPPMTSFSPDRPIRFPSVGLRPALSTYSLPTPAGLAALRPRLSVAPSMAGSGRRQPSSSLNSPTTSSLPPLPSPLDPPEPSSSAFPEIDNFDPTYGLRPEGLPAKSSYSGFGQLYVQNRGLGGLTDEESQRSSPQDADPYGAAEWEDSVPDSPEYDEPPAPLVDATEYETIPAVGGGTITRPRPHDSHAPRSSAAPSPGPLASPFQSESGRGRKLASSSAQSPLTQWVGHQEALRRQMGRAMPLGYDEPVGSLVFPSRAPLSRAGSHLRFEHDALSDTRGRRKRMSGAASSHLGSSVPTAMSRSSGAARTISTPPSSELPPVDEGGSATGDLGGGGRNRRRSLSPSMVSPMYPREVMYYDTPDNSTADLEREIVVRPGLNTTVTQLSALSQTNHTLSLYTPSVKHVTVRSVPRRPPTSMNATQQAERQPVKARRKRTYRIGKSANAAAAPFNEDELGSERSMSQGSSQSEFQHYFRHPGSLRIPTDDERF